MSSLQNKETNVRSCLVEWCPNTATIARRAISIVIAGFALTTLLRATDWSTRNGFEGAGFQNVLAINPAGGTVISGADVSGLQLSTNAGATGMTFMASNIGAPLAPSASVNRSPKVAAVAYTNDPNNPNRIYAGVGDGTTTDVGGIMRSDNGGATWTLVSTSSPIPLFIGNPPQPRPTGKLLLADEDTATNGGTAYLYAGTYSTTGSNGGMMRSTDHGVTWTTIGLQGMTIVYIAQNPTTADTLFVATLGSGVWKTTNARATPPTWTNLTTAPAYIRAIADIPNSSGSELYAAGGTGATSGGGVWKCVDGTTFTQLDGGLVAATGSNTIWQAIDGNWTGSAQVIYAGAYNPILDPDGVDYMCVMKSTDSGSTWTNITKTANVSESVGGPSGHTWWFSVTGDSGAELGPGGVRSHVAMIQVDQSNPARVYIAGAAGIWATMNATAADTSIIWYPMVSGLSVMVDNGVAVDPNNPTRVYVADTDRSILWSTDHGASIAASKPNSSTYPTSFAVFVDPVSYNGSASTVYAAQAAQGGSPDKGALYSNADPTTISTWTNEGLDTATSDSEPHGVIVGRDSGNNRIILAAVDNGQNSNKGIWRKSGSTWTNVNSLINPQAGLSTYFAWVPGSSWVYCYEQSTGLWASSNYGASWGTAPIWAKTNSWRNVGGLVADPAQAGQLYVSIGNGTGAGGVFRVTGANGGTITTTAMNGPTYPGALAFTHGILYAVDLTGAAIAGDPNATHDGALYQWLSPATSTVSSVISDGTYYPGQANWCSGLAVSGDNFIYGTQAGDGVASGVPWSSGDVGSVGLAGSTIADFETDYYVVSGAGANIYGTADAFQFYSQPIQGNVTIIAHVLSVTDTDEYAKGGIMIRQSLAANSAHATIDMTPPGGAAPRVEFLDRTTAGGTTNNTFITGTNSSYWLKLIRSGNTFSAWYSTNDTTWTQLGSNTTIAMSGTVYVGLIACSIDVTQLCTADIETVSVVPSP